MNIVMEHGHCSAFARLIERISDNKLKCFCMIKSPNIRLNHQRNRIEARLNGMRSKADEKMNIEIVFVEI